MDKEVYQNILSQVFGISKSQVELEKGTLSKVKTFILTFFFTNPKPIDYYVGKVSKYFQ